MNFAGEKKIRTKQQKPMFFTIVKKFLEEKYNLIITFFNIGWITLQKL